MSAPARAPGLHTTSLGESGSAGRLLPRAVRAGQELDHHRQAAGRATTGSCSWTCPTTDGPRGPSGSTTSRPPTRSPACCPPTTRWRSSGHSMGGKIAMLVALRHPELVERLCVVDVSPGRLPATPASSPATSVPCRHSTSPRSSVAAQADEGLVEAVPNPVVRSFLLQNLRHHGDEWSWQPNLDAPGSRPRRDRRLAGGGARRHRAVRRPGAVGRRRELGLRQSPSTSRRWTGGSPATAG